MQEHLLTLISYPYPLFKWLLPFDLYAYLIFGGMNTMLNIFLFILTHQAIYEIRYAVETATTIAFGITVITGFWLNKFCVFDVKRSSESPVRKQFLKYFMVSFQGLLGSILLLKCCTDFLGWPPVMSYFITTLIMLSLNFVLQRFFTFRR
ncbi:MAG: GtrA family protein [Chitinophagaceae bacterium]|jgi:putative flippase GtrA